jgi:tRNA-specific adenosine deaminase 1
MRRKQRSLTTSQQQQDVLKVQQQLLGETSTSSNSSPLLHAWIKSLTVTQQQALSLRLATLSQPATLGDVPEPTYEQLRLVALNNAIPFVGFGIMDNSILIIAGDAIDTSLGVVLGISTMCAAAIGNIVSDVAGIMLGTVVEDMAAQLNMPTANLTAAQRQLRSVRFANQLGCGVGLVIGCIIGMFPLLWMDPNKVKVKKQEAHLDAIFRDVVQEAGSLVGAQKMRLYIQVEDAQTSTTPTPHGKYLYAKFSDQKTRIPLGRGIVSRAALTGEAWKIDHVREEPDWDIETAKDAETMICVPVLDGNGKTIAVLQAINKVGKGQAGDEEQQQPWMVDERNRPRPFSQQDVQILKSLASHIGVSLQQLYDTAGEEENELRLKDTIQVLKQYGLEGLKGGENMFTPVSREIALFPEK